MWLITMVSKSRNWGYSPSKWPKWLINRGYYLLTTWDDPPSIVVISSKTHGRKRKDQELSSKKQIQVAV